MTKNDATPRERTGVMVHGYYLDDRGQIACAIDKVGFDWGWGQEDMLQAADDVIAYLWSRADDDDVVEAVDEALMKWARHPDRIIDGFDHEIRSIVAITATLTALIGPRPQGENDDE